MSVRSTDELAAKLLAQIDNIEADKDGTQIKKAMAICTVAGRVIQVEKFNRDAPKVLPKKS